MTSIPRFLLIDPADQSNSAPTPDKDIEFKIVTGEFTTGKVVYVYTYETKANTAANRISKLCGRHIHVLNTTTAGEMSRFLKQVQSDGVKYVSINFVPPLSGKATGQVHEIAQFIEDIEEVA
jgi:hypothetical protein